MTCDFSMGQYNLEFSSEELTLLSNCLNEVLNGFTVDNYEAILGASESQIASLLTLFNEPARLGPHQCVTLERGDLGPLCRSLRLTMNELGAEFSTRTGFSVDEADRLAIGFEQCEAKGER
jgi:hypothetical protein